MQQGLTSKDFKKFISYFQTDGNSKPPWLCLRNEQSKWTKGIAKNLKSEFLFRKGAHQVVKILYTEKHLLFVTVHSSSRWVKPAWLVVPTFSIPMLLMGTP